mgnify:CR=1 FL=1
MGVPLTAPTARHRHAWWVAGLGLIAGISLLVFVPGLRAISSSLLWLGMFHVLGGLVVAGTLWASFGRRRRADQDDLDFGWGPSWTIGPLVLAASLMSSAVALHLAAPSYWPVSILLAVLAANAFAGFVIAKASGQPDRSPLPLVDLLPGGTGLVLDGGCGAGRTSVSVARALPDARIIALDRFDASYIVGGGRELLERNLRIAKIENRVRPAAGDLTALNFPDASFDAAVSAHVIDHLGARQGLRRRAWRLIARGRQHRSRGARETRRSHSRAAARWSARPEPW